MQRAMRRTFHNHVGPITSVNSNMSMRIGITQKCTRKYIVYTSIVDAFIFVSFVRVALIIILYIHCLQYD